jgi:predicted DNA-binding antitoxin AbrB/MazE fold protein
MTITVEATYENGTLKLERPLPLKEHEKVKVTVEPESSQLVAGYGIMGWTGDAETIERFALSSEFDPNEAP